MRKAYGCPRCGSIEDFEEYDIVPGRAQITHFDEDGDPEWAGETDVDWDGQVPDPNAPARYNCHTCQVYFNKPILVDVED